MESGLLNWNYREQSHAGQRYKIALVPGILYLLAVSSQVSSLHSPLNKEPGLMVRTPQFPNSRTLIKHQNAWFNLSWFRSHKMRCHWGPLEIEGISELRYESAERRNQTKLRQRGPRYRASLPGSSMLGPWRSLVSRAVSLILLPSPVPPLMPASGFLAARVLNPEVYGHEVSLPYSPSRLNFPPPPTLAWVSHKECSAL